ncbi:hypothetical protein IAT38_001003 [Cryptococcus sp. DSM 104549]
MAEEKKPAAERPSWNKEEWAAKAKEKDEEGYKRAKEAEDALAQGKAPPRRNAQYDDLPKPTKALQAREEDLGLNKNLNKTMLVQTSTTGKGPRGAGFYCELCNRTFKDSLSYLDHVNGKLHLMKLGQTTFVERSTLSQVRAKIASLRASTQAKVSAKDFDFQERLKAVRSAETVERERRKEERRKRKEEKRGREEMSRMGIVREEKEKEGSDTEPEKGAKGKGKTGVKRGREDAGGDELVEKAIKENEDMSAMMGFGGFGTSKRR